MLATERHEFAALLTATMEVYSARVTPASLAIWWSALEQYPLTAIRGALSTHVQTPQRGTFAPKPADVIALLQAQDGRPGAEEAWAMLAHGIGNESATLVWTEEMRVAFFIADGLADDHVAARMAFKEAYAGALQEARARRVPVRWTATLGHDAGARAGPLLDAVQRGRLTAEAAHALLPELTTPTALAQAARAATLPPAKNNPLTEGL